MCGPGPAGNYDYEWSGPGGFTATSQCITVSASGTYTLVVIDRATNCRSLPCTHEISCPPVSLCRITGGGCLNEAGGTRGKKQNTFGGNVSPAHDAGGPTGNEWEHVLRDGRTILFNFHSHDAHIISCTILPPGPCSPPAVNTRADFEGTGQYSMGPGSRTEDANFSAYIIDHGEGHCGGTDYYTITVRKGLVQGAGEVVFTIAGEIDCGNLQIHELNSGPPAGTITMEPTTPEIHGLAVLNRAIPNPFSGTMSYSYRIPEGGERPVDVGVYDMAGRLIRKLVSGSQSSGTYTVQWDGRSSGGARMTPGVYFLRARVAGDHNMNRVILLDR